MNEGMNGLFMLGGPMTASFLQYIIIIINNSICLRHISSNKTVQRRITLYMNIQITLK